MSSPAPDTTDLRICIRDLAALSALSAHWSTAETAEIARSLADALLGMLPAEFVYVRAGGAETTAHRAVPSLDGPAHLESAQNIGKAIDGIIKLGVVDPVPTMPNPFGDGEVQVGRLSAG